MKYDQINLSMKKEIKYFTIACFVLFKLSLQDIKAAEGLILKDGIHIYTSTKVGEPLYKAVEALQIDIQKTTGYKSTILPLSAISSSGIVVINSQKDDLLMPLKGWEEHQVYQTLLNKTSHVVLQGADMRGAIYAVYSFSEKVLGIPPLWYYQQWQPTAQKQLIIPEGLNLHFKSPEVKYRAWFPNDMDMLEPWRKLRKENNEMWLQTALRLKINTIEWLDAGERDFTLKYSVSPTTALIHEYGLINTTHHHSPLNASFENWGDYWGKVKHTKTPELLLSNQKYLEEYWRYNIETAYKAGLDMIWVIGFRGAGDMPFWKTFKDAPNSIKGRGEVISQMMNIQRNLVIEITGNAKAQFRTIFYDELSDLLAQGFIKSPEDPNLILNFVAARRDHFPNDDIRNINTLNDSNLGYYFNCQFTSTGSHIAAAEGPWKMEQNYRYVAQKSKNPILFSVVNAGNIREHVMELSANAAMMYDFKNYNSDIFLRSFCKQYFGEENAQLSASLFKEYYNAYWMPKKADMKEIDRQYLFQDLRYRRAISHIAEIMNDAYDPNPLKDVKNEQLPGRTFRIVPSDYGFDNQVDAIIDGTSKSAEKFGMVAKSAEALRMKINNEDKAFFNDILLKPAYLMQYINQSLCFLTKAYKLQPTDKERKNLIEKSLVSIKNAQSILNDNEHPPFNSWYSEDKKFNLKGIASDIEKTLNSL